MSEGKWMNSLVAYLVGKSKPKAAKLMGCSDATIYDHILRLEAKRGQMLERNELGWITPQLTEYGRFYVARMSKVEPDRIEEVADSILDFPDISADDLQKARALWGETVIQNFAAGLSSGKTAVEAAETIETIGVKRVQIRWDRKVLTDLGDIPEEVWQRVREGFIERTIARAFELPPTIWHERPSLGSGATHNLEVKGAIPVSGDDVLAAVRDLWKKLASKPFVKAFWFVDRWSELTQLETMFGVTPVTERSLMDISVYVYETRLFDSKMDRFENPPWLTDEFLAALDDVMPWWFEYIKEGPPVEGEARRPWCCAIPGIWMEMSDGHHRLIGSAKLLADCLKSMSAEGRRPS